MSTTVNSATMDWNKRDDRGGLSLDGHRFGPNRNAACYCGSGKKLKRCCGAVANQTARVIDPRFETTKQK